MTATTDFPPEPTSFVGRQSDVDELAQLLAVSRVVTLCGAGGIGKTRLALKVGAEIAERFPGGARLVELGGAAQPQEIAACVAAVLRVSPEGSHSHEDAVVEAIGDRRVLLVLDGCDSLPDDCARLCRRVLSACPEAKILATGRRPLGLARETAWRVPPLTLPEEGDDRWTGDLASCEAVRLFHDRAEKARPGFTPARDGIASLVRRLGGIPLAIELVAATMCELTVEEAVARTGRHFREMSPPVREGAISRHRVVAATIDWSYHLLSDPEKALLRRVTVFKDGWTLRMAEQVCAGSGLWVEDVPPHTRGLISRSLVVLDGEMAGEARYRLLRPIRDYAAERLSTAGEEDRFRRRHRDYVHQVAEKFDAAIKPGPHTPWPTSERLLRQLEGLKPDLASAIRWSIDIGDPEPAIRLIVNLRWVVIGAGTCRFQVAAWLERLLATAPPHLPGTLRGQALALRGTLALMQGRRDEAGEYAEAGLASYRSAQGLAGDALALILFALLDQPVGPAGPTGSTRPAGPAGMPGPVGLAASAEPAGLTARGRRMTADQAMAYALEITTQDDRHPEPGTITGPRAPAPPGGPPTPASRLTPGNTVTEGNSLAPGNPLAPGATLTAREQEIALLIVQGLSNRAIAAELVISSATVARHVANMLAKLGFSSRTQVAAWMVEWGAYRSGARD
ncbi:LuxR C-terminal-related transcriptional regulator [Sphaerisporangium sp. NPDC088356]|uniref:LuxR C-terminal-related transcriptional regulator n=1 Tax=Sphaerisporangium sp. NPDC088356 TaxID=3154871 RepID=UPI0034407EA1